MRYETNTHATSPPLSPKPTCCYGGSRANIGVAHPVVYLAALAFWALAIAYL